MAALNEFVAYADFGPNVKNLSHQTVVVVTFALAGFANFASIAIQIGSIGVWRRSAAVTWRSSG